MIIATIAIAIAVTNHLATGTKAPPEFSGKPCRVHGDKAKHTYEECRDNPKNRKPSSGNRDDNNNKKRHHDAHYHEERYLSSQDESPDDHRTPEPSDDD